MNFELIDYVIFVLYCLTIIGIGLWVSKGEKGVEKTSEDYFLASKSLPWWAIGASLIAANISAEQFIGMSGSGFALGLGIASYEWMSAITLIVVGKYFLPIFIEKGLYTIPDFIEKRYSKNLKSILAVFWLILFVFVNLTSVLYLGAKALDTIIGTGDGSYVVGAIIGLALFAAAYSLYGGLSAVAWTDVFQVVLLVAGGIITTFIALDHLTPDGGIIDGFKHLMEVAPEKFSMILSEGEIITPDGKDAYFDLPSLSVLIGGMWVANLYYWGFNQYIIQRTLAAKSVKESQKGIIFAGFMKMIIPLIVVVPGIIAFVMYAQPEGTSIIAGVTNAFTGGNGQVMNDNAYPWLISEFVPAGLKGLVVAALTAAIVSSVASMLNSTATIFTMDIYKEYINKNSSENSLVTTGRLSALAALIIAVPTAFSLSSLGQVFQFIQEWTGVVSPGILVVFMLGLFWKKTTNKAAIIGVIASVVFGVGMKLMMANGMEIHWLKAWMHQVELIALFTLIVMVLVSYMQNKGEDDAKGIDLGGDLFKTDKVFNIAALVIIVMTVTLYVIFW
ncbi:MAG: sodium/sugar symporter [Cyclobacteriaceae bacterium]